jgi:hypothetical protein
VRFYPGERDKKELDSQPQLKDSDLQTIQSIVTKISLALSSRRDNHSFAATAKVAVQIVALQTSAGCPEAI